MTDTPEPRRTSLPLVKEDRQLDRKSSEYADALDRVNDQIAEQPDPGEWYVDHTRYGWPYARRWTRLKRRPRGEALTVLGSNGPTGQLHPDDKARILAAQRMQRKIESEGFARGYAHCAQQFGAEILELQGTILEDALGPDATVEEKRLAHQVSKDILDRLMGKAKQTMEIEHTKGQSAPLDRLAELADTQPIIDAEVVDEDVEGDRPELTPTWDE
jgi:hypothetical protein